MTNLSDDPQKVLESIGTQVAKSTSETLSIINDVQQLVSQEGEHVESPLGDEEMEILFEEIPGKVQISLADKNMGERGGFVTSYCVIFLQ